MGRQRIYESGLYNQYEEILSKFEKQECLLKEANGIIKTLNSTIESLNELVRSLQEKNDKQAKEFLSIIKLVLFYA